ncbi:hypothetical protein M2368_003598 [Arthrobacter sp. JUb119]|nr:hypothetical protein [Arthrobacter sp. JUb119]TDU30506.1 hypothetical protein EDF61_101467 [Arthrobacter sp. JUb115]
MHLRTRVKGDGVRRFSPIEYMRNRLDDHLMIYSKPYESDIPAGRGLRVQALVESAFRWIGEHKDR